MPILSAHCIQVCIIMQQVSILGIKIFGILVLCCGANSQQQCSCFHQQRLLAIFLPKRNSILRLQHAVLRLSWFLVNFPKVPHWVKECTAGMCDISTLKISNVSHSQQWSYDRYIAACRRNPVLGKDLESHSPNQRRKSHK